MKNFIFLIFLALSAFDSFSQNDSLLTFIFVPHPRSEEKIRQSTLSGIEKIDFSRFDMVLLGGDLTYYTSRDRTVMNYCDSLFDLGSSSTLWSLGNHDVSGGSRTLIKEYTGRESYYTCHRNGITFLVLDTELAAQGFTSTFILGNQLQMVQNVCDTISESRYLILLHHRFLWMINNEYFINKLDSVAASSKSLDTTNFYAGIYPLLKKVKANGTEVICLGGDKSDINISYSPEDSITFYASRMTTYFNDSVNNVVLLNFNLNNNMMTCEFVSLAELNKDDHSTSSEDIVSKTPESISMYPNPVTGHFRISGIEGKALLLISDLNGRLLISEEVSGNDEVSSGSLPPGIYILKIVADNKISVRKILKQ